MDVITLTKINEVYMHVGCDAGIAMELNEHFSFYVEGYKFMPIYRNGMWDGKIYLFDRRKSQLYLGLLDEIAKFAADRQYTLDLQGELLQGDPAPDMEELGAWIASLELHSNGIPIVPHGEQISALAYAIQHNRLVAIIPTGGGKSLIAYLFCRWFLEQYDSQVLISVPTTSLVEQLTKDFADYSIKDESFNTDDTVHKIYSGKDKNTDKPIVISTWQSIFRLHARWFENFGAIIGDEAHTFKAKSLNKIMESLVNAKYRIGLTGTLDGSSVSEMSLKGLFGPVKRFVTTKELMDRGVLAELDIQALMLNYSEEESKAASRLDYANEMKWLVEHPGRNKFVADMALNLEGNTIIMFKIIKHGEEMFRIIDETNTDPERKIYFVSGKVQTDDRERIRQIIETEKNAIVVASMGVFSTGINIRNIHNIVFAAPVKSLIKVLQSIGRGLRKSDNGAVTRLFDISDNLSRGSRKNFSLLHGAARLKIYVKEKFNFKVTEINISG